MADKSIIKKVNVASGGTATHDFPALASGEIYRLRKFGGLDINLGDSKSSLYLLQWGTTGSFDEIRALSLSGNTYEYVLQKDIVGDGSKFLRVWMKNFAGFSKDLVFWLEVHSRD